MKRSPIPFALLGALVFLTSCADDKTPVGPSALPTLAASSELATFPVSAELGTCGLSNAVAVRFSGPAISKESASGCSSD